MSHAPSRKVGDILSLQFRTHNSNFAVANHNNQTVK